jgi:hypothetical protein
MIDKDIEPPRRPKPKAKTVVDSDDDISYDPTEPEKKEQFLKSIRRTDERLFMKLAKVIIDKLHVTYTDTDPDSTANELNRLLDTRKIQKYSEHVYNPLLRAALDKGLLAEIPLGELIGSRVIM